MSSLKDRVKSLQADTTNTDTALTTLEEALAEKVSMASCSLSVPKVLLLTASLQSLMQHQVLCLQEGSA